MQTPARFEDVLAKWPSAKVRDLIMSRTEEDAAAALRATGAWSPETLAALLSPAAERFLEQLKALSADWTRRRFGRTVQVFDPLYVSNYCCNGCRYCGFNARSRDTVRRALSLEEAEAEARALAASGVKNILLLSGEDKVRSSPEYFCRLARAIRPLFAEVSVEIYACTEDEYRELHAAGVDGMTMFQETYNPAVYREYHPFGPKADFSNRLDAYDRAARAGMAFLGLGALLGINDWREEGFFLGLHAAWLRKRHWRCATAFSFPRIRPAHGGEPPPFPLSDAGLVQLMCALRVSFPDSPITVSTREAPGFREELVRLAATKISAGAKTTPGGYTSSTGADAQFETSDRRSVAEVLASLRANGIDPVMKDWDGAFSAAPGAGDAAE